MKTTLTYEFNLPEDRDDFDLITNHQKYYLFYEDLMNKLRQIRKYDEASYPKDIDALFDLVLEIAKDNNLN